MALAQTKKYTEDDYYSLPEGVRAELIDGQIYYQAAPSRIHQRLLSDLHGTIYNYIKSNYGSCQVYPAPFAVKLFDDGENIVEPDISVICDHGKLTDKGCSGAPDWIIEIVSPSSRTIDYYNKLFKYRTAGVREYWIVDHERDLVTVYNFQNDSAENYAFVDSIPVGIYPGFSINLSTLNI